MIIDINKTYRTRNGLKVEIYAKNPDQEWAVHGAVDEAGVWYQRAWKIDGTSAYPEHPLDLVEVKPRIKGEVWLNIYPWGCGWTTFKSRETAKKGAERGCIACVKIEYDVEEGEGLD